MSQTNFQECAHLEIEDIYSQLTADGKDGLAHIFQMQHDIQTQVYGYDFDKMRETLGSMKQFSDVMYHADQDEWREYFNALGGIHSDGAAIWKPWKSKHLQTQEKSFSDLTPEEVKELQMEVIDRLHFFLNIANLVGLTPASMVNMYIAKNKENIERQKRGNY